MVLSKQLPPPDDTLQPPNTTAHKKTLHCERWIYGFMFSVQTETNHVCGWKTGEKWILVAF